MAKKKRKILDFRAAFTIPRPIYHNHTKNKRAFLAGGWKSGCEPPTEMEKQAAEWRQPHREVQGEP